MIITTAQAAKFNRIIAGIAEAQDGQAMGYLDTASMRRDIASYMGELTADELPLYEAHRKRYLGR